jgi:hypothetical protein
LKIEYLPLLLYILPFVPLVSIVLVTIFFINRKQKEAEVPVTLPTLQEQFPSSVTILSAQEGTIFTQSSNGLTITMPSVTITSIPNGYYSINWPTISRQWTPADINTEWIVTEQKIEVKELNNDNSRRLRLTD